MSKLPVDCQAVVTRFVYNLCNGLLAYPILKDCDYRSVIVEEPSSAEQAVAVFLNVLEVSDIGVVSNAEAAELRAGQWLRSYCDPSYQPELPFEDWETKRAPYGRRSSGPMP